ncbi:tetratricopeptide repeat-containing protein [uncultured Aquimarina sp.]|uniref:tetratricopeptide repeat-containing protein n=1 Tax=uncultured Aquimarina sp. TaxID=575652 RepID=UPI002608E23B|nr:tetratricopeptide repeat-containing protein [uncultured Aquimarina sp.]
MEEKTCFVIMGFGEKTDYKTGQTFNLDKTYKNLIKPVFEGLGFICFRADEIPSSGVIDTAMYESILKADFVVADLSTLNPNAFYELGVRHALKKNTTILIAETGVKYPFDVQNIYIHPYEHLGKDIGVDEAKRFNKLLKEKVKALLDNPKVDSPVYTYIPNLNTPSFTQKEVEEIKEEIAEEKSSVADFLEIAENAKDNKNYKLSLKYLEKAKKIYPNSDFLNQRLALSTYKLKEPDEKTSLYNALDILTSELKLDTTTDPETLGLAGAIFKRLYWITNDSKYFKKSLWNYSRGFYIKQDYYTGINLSFLKFLKASESEDHFIAYSNFGQAKEICNRVEQICKTIIKSDSSVYRDDWVWIYLTLAEVAFSKGDLKAEKMYINLAKEESKGDFNITSYNEQNKKLDKAIKTFKTKYDIS